VTRESAKKLAKLLIPLQPHHFEFCNSSNGLCECGLPFDNAIHLTLPVEKRIVLMLNDYPVGVYTTAELAYAAAHADWKRREPRWKELGLMIGQSVVSGHTEKPVPYAKWYYRNYEFVVDAEAKL
jgi:hypothetical protein